MRRRVALCALCLTMMSTLPVLAVETEISGMSPQIAKAYLSLVDQQVRQYGGYASTSEFPMNPGFGGGFIRDFDRDGTPELYLISLTREYRDYVDKANEQIWTWDGNRAKLLQTYSYVAYGIRSCSFSTLFVRDGLTYYKNAYSGFPGAGGGELSEGTLYTVNAGTWKETFYYQHHIPDSFLAVGDPITRITRKDGLTTTYLNDATYDAAVARHEGTDSLTLVHEGAGCMSLGFEPNGSALRKQLVQLAENRPSSWAEAEITQAVASGIIPTLTGNPAYQSIIDRQQFAELVVALTEKAIGTELPAAPSGTFSDCDTLAVRKAFEAGIVTGVGGGRFAPSYLTNREEIATMLNRAIEYIKEKTGTDLTPLPASLNKFIDYRKVSSWAVEGMGALAANGILNGTSDTTLSPKDTCTVEQSILLSSRIHTKLP